MLIATDTSLPQQLEHFHSIVALDTNTQKAPNAYGYPNWVYKAVSNKDGYTYALRRLEGRSRPMVHISHVLIIRRLPFDR